MPGLSLPEKLRSLVAGAPADVVAVYLYGSQARGTASPDSDIDLGLLLREAPPPKLRSTARKIESDVERAVHLPAEAVVMNTASPDLVHRILRDGILLLDRDRAARLRFEVQARNEYFDLAPIRRLYRRVPA
jgi:predicted nucleotidyltransferase